MNDTAEDFQARLKGRFQGMLHWKQLDELWARVKPGAWYFYQLGETVPAHPLQGEALTERLDALDALLRREHESSYCGIVYADDAEQPTLIKVYDPNHMGSSCSGNSPPSPPGWILSTFPPQAIELDAPVPQSRRRWWQLLGK